MFPVFEVKKAMDKLQSRVKSVFVLTEIIYNKISHLKCLKIISEAQSQNL